MNPLICGLPRMINVGGVEYEIETDFRKWLWFQGVMDESELIKDEQERAIKRIQVMDLFINPPVEISFVVAAIPALAQFYSCKLPGIENDSVQDSGGRRPAVFDYKQDVMRVYAAFQQAFKINLFDIEYLHWWEFMALLDNLPENTRLREIMAIRSTDTSSKSKLPKEEKERIRRLQDYFSITPRARRAMTIEERDAEWKESFRKNAKQAGLQKLGDMPIMRATDEDEPV